MFAMKELYSSCIVHSHSLEFSHVNVSSIFWGSSKNAIVARSLDGLSFETTNFSFDENFGVDWTPFIVVPFRGVSQLKVNDFSPSIFLVTIPCTTFSSFLGWSVPYVF